MTIEQGHTSGGDHQARPDSRGPIRRYLNGITTTGRVAAVAVILVVGGIVFAVANSNGPTSGSGASIDDQYFTQAVNDSDISLGTSGRGTILSAGHNVCAGTWTDTQGAAVIVVGLHATNSQATEVIAAAHQVLCP